MALAGVVAMTSGAPSPSAASAQSAVRTATPRRSPHSCISSARARERTYTVTSPEQIRARAASAEEAVAPAPRMVAFSTLSTPRSWSAETMPGMSVLSPRRRPSLVRTTVLTASTEAAVSLMPSSSGMTARLSGIVRDSPAHSGPRPATNCGSAASSISKRS